MRTKIVRLRQGQMLALEESWRVDRLLATEYEPIGPGTNTECVDVLLVVDERFWLSDPDAFGREERAPVVVR